MNNNKHNNVNKKQKNNKKNKSTSASSNSKKALGDEEQYITKVLKPLLENDPVPMDPLNSNYTMSFQVDQEAEILEFFDKYGFVVVRDLLTIEECQRSVEDVFDILRDGCLPGGNFDRSDPTTWNQWPENGMEHFGTVQRPPIFSRQFLLNRMNEKVYRVFKTLLNEEDLIVNQDRGCLYRPTVNVPGVSYDVSRKWTTKPNLHLDMNPWNWITSDGTEQDQALARLAYGHRLNDFIFENNQVTHNDGLQLQAVLNLVNNFSEDGGFQVVPKFHKIYDEYFKNVKPTGDVTRPSYSFPPSDPINKYSIRVSMRPGSMVVWSQKMPHGSLPNRSSRMRCAQFLKMFPAKQLEIHPDRAIRRANTIQNMLNSLSEPIELTDLGKKLFGLNVIKTARVSYPKSNRGSSSSSNSQSL